MSVDFAKLMQMFGSAGQGSQQVNPMKDGKASSIVDADNIDGGQKLTQALKTAQSGGSLINTNAKDAGGYTDASSSAIDGAMKGAQIGGPVGGAVGAVVGLAKGFQNRGIEHRNNQTRLMNAGRQQAADSYSAFDRIIGGLR